MSFLFARLTSSKYGYNAHACGLQHSQTLVVEVAYVDGLTNTKGSDVDYELVQEVLLQARNGEFAAKNLEFTTGLNTLRVTNDSNGNLDRYGFACNYTEEVDVLAVVLYGVELSLAHNTFLDVTVDVELYDVRFGSVKEFFSLRSLNREVDSLATVTVEYAGNKVLAADVFCAFFAKYFAFNAFDLNGLHSDNLLKLIMFLG